MRPEIPTGGGTRISGQPLLWLVNAVPCIWAQLWAYTHPEIRPENARISSHACVVPPVSRTDSLSAVAARR